MQIELSPDDIETIIREADAAAQRLRRKLCLPVCEHEDLGQDLLVDLLRRLPAYDPSRGSIGAFANIVLRNQSSRIAMRHYRQRRAQGGSLLSLEVPLAGTREPVGDTLTEDDGLAAWHGQTCCAATVTELHHAPGAFSKECPGPCRQEQPAGGLRLHRHGLCPAGPHRGQRSMASRGRPDAGQAAEARHPHGR